MQELIEVIRAAIATEATTEQKAAGVQACRTIDAALATEPGKPLTIVSAVSATPVQAMPRVSIDQVLDLVIARLSVIAKEREPIEALPAPSAGALTSASSQGLRVPMATGGALKVVRRPANARPVPARPAPRPANARPVPARPAPRPANPRPGNIARPTPRRKP
jgi:hypothetical protein